MSDNFKTAIAEPLRVFTPPDMIQIPLEEYKKFVEYNIKGPTVEIPLMEYNGLKEDINHLRYDNIRLENENQNLVREINSRADIKQIMDQGIERIKREFSEHTKVTDSDTERGVKKNGI